MVTYRKPGDGQAFIDFGDEIVKINAVVCASRVYETETGITFDVSDALKLSISGLRVACADIEYQYLPDGFWDAVSILLGDEYEWFAFDDDEQPYVYVRRGDTWGSGLTKVRKLDLPKMDAGTDWGKTLTRRPFLRIGQTKEE